MIFSDRFFKDPMTDIKPSNEMLIKEIAHLREKFIEAQEVLQAIRDGSVDAVVVSGRHGDRTYTLKGADYTYRVLIETITEGAVILSEDGTILYCNGRFAEMVQTPIENVIGGSMSEFIEPCIVINRHTFEASAYPSGQGGLSVLARDITERQLKEEELRQNAAELSQKASQLARLSSDGLHPGLRHCHHESTR